MGGVQSTQQEQKLQGWQTVNCPQQPTGAVVRPINGRNEVETLVFLGDELRPLHDSVTGSGATLTTFGVSSSIRLRVWPLRNTTCPIYDRSIGCLFCVECGSAIMRVDGTAATLAAGSLCEKGRKDGREGSARFEGIRCITSDDKGHIFITEGYDIRVLELNSGEVTTLQGSAVERTPWECLTYDKTRDVLIAATRKAVCSFSQPPPGLLGRRWRSASRRLLAGTWGSSARTPKSFHSISAILSLPSGLLYVAEANSVSSIDAAGNVSTALQISEQHGVFQPRQLVLLPRGELALIAQSAYQPGSVLLVAGERLETSNQPIAPAPASLPDLLTPPVRTDKCPAAAAFAVTVTTADGKAFYAQRPVLQARSWFFRLQLQTAADSGAAEVSLPGADSRAFGHLLAYMYTGELGVPKELLRPAAALARQLSLDKACLEKLQKQLLEMVTPETVIADIAWAEKHVPQLVPELKSFLIRHRRQVVKAGATVKGGLKAQLLTVDPQLASEILAQLLAE